MQFPPHHLLRLHLVVTAIPSWLTLRLNATSSCISRDRLVYEARRTLPLCLTHLPSPCNLVAQVDKFGSFGLESIDHTLLKLAVSLRSWSIVEAGASIPSANHTLGRRSSLPRLPAPGLPCWISGFLSSATLHPFTRHPAYSISFLAPPGPLPSILLPVS